MLDIPQTAHPTVFIDAAAAVVVVDGLGYPRPDVRPPGGVGGGVVPLQRLAERLYLCDRVELVAAASLARTVWVGTAGHRPTYGCPHITEWSAMAACVRQSRLTARSRNPAGERSLPGPAPAIPECPRLDLDALAREDAHKMCMQQKLGGRGVKKAQLRSSADESIKPTVHARGQTSTVHEVAE